MDHVDLDFGGRRLGQLVSERFHGAAHVPLQDHVQTLDLARLDLGVKLLEGRRLLGAAEALLALEALPPLRDVPYFFFVFQYREAVTRLPGLR